MILNLLRNRVSCPEENDKRGDIERHADCRARQMENGKRHAGINSESFRERAPIVIARGLTDQRSKSSVFNHG